MVCGFLADHLPAIDASMDRTAVARCGPDRRVHAGSTSRGDLAGGGHLAIRTFVGRRSSSKFGGAAVGIRRHGFISRVLCRPVAYHSLGTALSAGSSLLLPVVSAGIVALVVKRPGIGACGRIGTPRHPAFWLCFVCYPCSVAGLVRCAVGGPKRFGGPGSSLRVYCTHHGGCRHRADSILARHCSAPNRPDANHAWQPSDLPCEFAPWLALS